MALLILHDEIDEVAHVVRPVCGQLLVCLHDLVLRFDVGFEAQQETLLPRPRRDVDGGGFHSDALLSDARRRCHGAAARRQVRAMIRAATVRATGKMRLGR